MARRLHAAVPCRLDFCQGVVALVNILCSGLEQHEIYHVLSAVSEALTNVVVHSKLDESDMLEVEARREDDQLEVSILDDGIPYQPRYPAPREHVDPLTLDDGGMGMLLIARCMDVVRYERTDRNKLYMVKRLGIGVSRDCDD